MSYYLFLYLTRKDKKNSMSVQARKKSIVDFIMPIRFIYKSNGQVTNCRWSFMNHYI